MIANERRTPERRRLELESNPLVRRIYEAAERHPDLFELDEGAAGLDLGARALQENKLPNRARLKAFSPKPGHTLVFFYKRSLVPYSRDRYSYGGLDLKSQQVGDDEIDSWLRFLSSGFLAELRPANLRRAFPYEIPE